MTQNNGIFDYLFNDAYDNDISPFEYNNPTDFINTFNNNIDLPINVKKEKTSNDLTLEQRQKLTAQPRYRGFYNLDEDDPQNGLDILEKMHKKPCKTSKLTYMPKTHFNQVHEATKPNYNYVKYKAKKLASNDVKDLIHSIKYNYGKLFHKYGVRTEKTANPQNPDIKESIYERIAKDTLQKGYKNLEHAFKDDCFVDIDNFCLVDKTGSDIIKSYSMKLNDSSKNPTNANILIDNDDVCEVIGKSLTKPYEKDHQNGSINEKESCTGGDTKDTNNSNNLNSSDFQANENLNEEGDFVNEEKEDEALNDEFGQFLEEDIKLLDDQKKNEKNKSKKHPEKSEKYEKKAKFNKLAKKIKRDN